MNNPNETQQSPANAAPNADDASLRLLARVRRFCDQLSDDKMCVMTLTKTELSEVVAALDLRRAARDGVALQTARHPPDSRIELENAYDQALADLGKATDGRWRSVRLMPPEPCVETLRRTTLNFGRINDGFPPSFPSSARDHDERARDQDRAEISFWRNLALLANATACALALNTEQGS